MMREAGSNDLGHKQEDKRAGDRVDAGAVVVLCGHQGLSCFLHLKCKFEITYIFQIILDLFLSHLLLDSISVLF